MWFCLWSKPEAKIWCCASNDDIHVFSVHSLFLNKIHQRINKTKHKHVTMETLITLRPCYMLVMCLFKLSILSRGSSQNKNHARRRSGSLENNGVCPGKQGSVGDFCVPPLILPHLVDGSSNRHDWLTFRLVPFWDLQLSLAWPLPPDTPTDTPFADPAPELDNSHCWPMRGLLLLPHHVKTSLGGTIQPELH